MASEKSYQVSLGQTAEDDLDELYEYIATVLKNPTAALRVYTSIKTSVLSLSSGPLSRPLVSFEPHRSRGIRWKPAENYMIFFKVDEANATAQVLRILYKRRQWQSLL